MPPKLHTKMVQFAQGSIPEEEELLDFLIQQKDNRYPKSALSHYVKLFLLRQQPQPLLILDETRKLRKVQSFCPNVMEKLLQIFAGRLRWQKQLQDKSLQPPKSVLLVGGVGSGKSTVLKDIQSQLQSSYIIKMFSCFKLSLEEIEQLSKQTKGTQGKPVLLLLDDIDVYIQKKGPRPLKLYAFIDSLMNSHNTFLLCTTSNCELLQEGLKRPGRLDLILNLDNPPEQMRRNILSNIDEGLGQYAAKTSGYVPADFRALSQQLALKVISKRDQGQSAELNSQDLQKTIKEMKPLSRKEGFASIPDTCWEDVGALAQEKQLIYNSVILPIKYPSKFKRLNISASSGILLFGPPGCGKTMLAKAVAHQANANFITIKGPQLLSKYVGQSQEAVRNVFERARAATPCVIFFDEFDALAPRRQNQGNQVSERVVNTLLNELGGIQERKSVFVIAATNRPDMIDPAILRSGRIQKHIYIPLPDKNDRQAILRSLLKSVPHQSLDYRTIVEDPRCQGFSGADLGALVKEAGLQAVLAEREQIGERDLVSALGGVRASIGAEQRRRYERLCSKIS